MPDFRLAVPEGGRALLYYFGMNPWRRLPDEAADEPLLHRKCREQPGGGHPPDAAEMGAARVDLSNPGGTFPPEAVLLAGHRAGAADPLPGDPQARSPPGCPDAAAPRGRAQGADAGQGRW